MKTEALIYSDEDGVIREGFDGIDRAIIGETYEEIDRIRECQNTKCERIFWAGRSTVRGKRIEGCSPACLNILRLKRRDRAPTKTEIDDVSKGLRAMNRAMNSTHMRKPGSAWRFEAEADAESIENLIERYMAKKHPKGRVKRTIQYLMKQQSKDKAG
jgi:hypothetical protein